MSELSNTNENQVGFVRPQAITTQYPGYYNNDFDIDDSIRTFWNVVLRRKWLILFITLVSIGFSAFVVEEPDLEYTATSTIQIKEYLAPLGGHLQDQLSRETRHGRYINTLLELITTRSTAEYVLSNPDIEKKVKLYFDRESLKKSEAEIKDNKQALWEKYTKLISYEQTKDTDLVRLSVTTKDKELSALIANAHSDAFSEISQRERQSSAIKVHDFLQERSEKLRIKAEELEEKVVKYADKNSLYFNAFAGAQYAERNGNYNPALSGDNNFSISRLNQAYGDLSNVKTQKNRAEALVSQYRGRQSSSKDPIVDMNNDSAERIFEKLVQEEAAFERFAKILKGGKSNPYVKELAASIRNKKKALKSLEKTQLALYEVEAKARRDQAQLLEEEIQQIKNETIQMRKKLSEFDKLKNEFFSVRQTYNFLLERLEEAKIAVASNNANISIVDKAIPPIVADNADQKTYFVLIGAFFGPLIGIALAFFLHLLDNTIRTTEDISRNLKVPSLGIIPAFSGANNTTKAKNNQNLALENLADQRQNLKIGENNSGNSDETSVTERPNISANNKVTQAFQKLTSNELSNTNTTIMARETMIFDTHSLIAAAAPWSLESEAFRNIRTTISYSTAEKAPTSLLITSGTKGDGKSTVCSNLAVSLAQNSNRVLLIDGDLRRPSMNKLFNIPRTTPGLADYLAGQRDWSEVMLMNVVENLTIIAAGTPPPNPTELLGSRRMSDLIEMMSAEYDYVLIDSPPVIALADARVLSTMVDGVIFVTRSGKTSKPAAQKATGELKQVGAKIIGSILNGVDVSNYSGYDANSMYYYVEPEM